MAYVYYNQKYDHYGLVWKDTIELPPDAVFAGIERSNSRVYVGRVLVNNWCKAGKYVADLHKVYVSNSGVEVAADRFQVLTNPNNSPIGWEYCRGWFIPPNAVVGGQMNGRLTYIGRCRHEGHTVVRHVDSGRLWYRWDGKEYTASIFDCLVVKYV